MGACATKATEQEGQSRESVWLTLYRFLGSSRFGLFLLLTIGSVSFVGMLILQNAPEEQYELRYGEFWSNLILHTGLGTVYRTWWYLLLIFLAALNLFLCSLSRIRISFKQAFSRPKAEDRDAFEDARSVRISCESSEIAERIQAGLDRRGFRAEMSHFGPVKIIAAKKGGLSRIGFLVTHLAVILVLVAAAVNGRLGYSYNRTVSIGEAFEVSEIDPSADFSIRVDDFIIETTEEGKIRDFKSTLTVVETGKDVVTKVIEVNVPLSYKGISFYQASYGQEPDRIKDALLFYTSESTSTFLEVPFGEKRKVPGTDMEVAVTDYVPHFVKDLSTGVVRSRSREPRLPAVKLEVIRGDDVLDGGWLIMGMDVHSGEGELAHFHFADYYPVFYTGLDVAKNPGVSLMLAGFTVATIGIFLSFFVSYKRIWVRISEDVPTHCELRVIGSSPKRSLAVKQDVEILYSVAQCKRGHIESNAKL